jgi:hypothetical protein
MQQTERRPEGIRILHYHLFKNAGTSVDEMLKRNFGCLWTQHEFDGDGNRANSDQIRAFLMQRSDVVALSSHTALLPIPKLSGERILPIVFVRHPIIRIRSSYAFERRQDANTFGAQLAKTKDLAGYVATLLQHPQNRSARNFQTLRLAHNEPPICGTELERSRRTISTLPFVGLVEAYEQSLATFETLAREHFPNFNAVVVKMNATNADATNIASQLEEIRRELGESLYESLVQHNRDDLEIFEIVKQRYEAVSVDQTNV